MLLYAITMGAFTYLVSTVVVRQYPEWDVPMISAASAAGSIVVAESLAMLSQ